jgi:hypothetical protein
MCAEAGETVLPEGSNSSCFHKSLKVAEQTVPLRSIRSERVALTLVRGERKGVGIKTIFLKISIRIRAGTLAKAQLLNAETWSNKTLQPQGNSK